jgi:hypothetical protein
MSSCPDHLTMLAAMLPGDARELSLLDLGCGDATHTRHLPSARRTFVDIERRPGSPEPFVEADAIRFLREGGDGHDLLFCLDTIEHLDRPVGDELLRLATAKARRLSVFFTPLGPMHIRLDHPMGHRTGWWPDDFAAEGYHTWTFPRFHDPWYDGLVWGAFYAWKWTRPEPVAEARLAALAERIPLVHSVAGLRHPRLQAMSSAQAAHWRSQLRSSAARLFPSETLDDAGAALGAEVDLAVRNDAAFVRQSVPESMVASSTNALSITFRNTGVTTWTPDAQYALGIPDNSMLWGVVRARLARPVFPGEEAVFEFSVVAPAVAGSHLLSWRMVQEAVEWFGPDTPPVSVRVTASPPR